jgi:hypothetical protein
MKRAIGTHKVIVGAEIQRLDDGPPSLDNDRNEPTKYDKSGLPDSDTSNCDASGKKSALDSRRAFRQTDDGTIHSSVS